jgi:hypothetical protein
MQTVRCAYEQRVLAYRWKFWESSVWPQNRGVQQLCPLVQSVSRLDWLIRLVYTLLSMFRAMFLVSPALGWLTSCTSGYIVMQTCIKIHLTYICSILPLYTRVQARKTVIITSVRQRWNQHPRPAVSTFTWLDRSNYLKGPSPDVATLGYAYLCKVRDVYRGFGKGYG